MISDSFWIFKLAFWGDTPQTALENSQPLSERVQGEERNERHLKWQQRRKKISGRDNSRTETWALMCHPDMRVFEGMTARLTDWAKGRKVSGGAGECTTHRVHFNTATEYGSKMFLIHAHTDGVMKPNESLLWSSTLWVCVWLMCK